MDINVQLLQLILTIILIPLFYLLDRKVRLNDDSRAGYRAEIVKIWEKSEHQGFILEWDLDTVNSLFPAYKRRGGNSYIEKLVEHMNEMDVRSHTNSVKLPPEAKAKRESDLENDVYF